MTSKRTTASFLYTAISTTEPLGENLAADFVINNAKYNHWFLILISLLSLIILVFIAVNNFFKKEQILELSQQLSKQVEARNNAENKLLGLYNNINEEVSKMTATLTLSAIYSHPSLGNHFHGFLFNNLNFCLQVYPELCTYFILH